MEFNKEILEKVLDDIQADIAEFGDDPWLNSMVSAIADIIVGKLPILPADLSEGSKSGQQMVSNAYWTKFKTESKS